MSFQTTTGSVVIHSGCHFRPSFYYRTSIRFFCGGIHTKKEYFVAKHLEVEVSMTPEPSGLRPTLTTSDHHY